ncbi:NAD(P)/FAD-dependent oxidoreductase [Proteiniclasticum sp.]|uniref:dihydrolipoyl dehydrogenase family protein n=1 Tax=Proteiniclasticum sp. TaxID=2053595 RepID=UPI0028A196D1|nr:NAD(P)/FAD-dependent oxidoreductase [Proteiniclasticum sp.]
MKKYDLIVIGTGAAGSSAAYRCREAGLSVAVIDRLPYGGTCALRGCDPKKVLVGASEIVDRIHRMKGLGMEEGSKVNWNELMKFKRTFIEGVPESHVEAYHKAGIDTYHGEASLTGENTILLDGSEFSFKHLLIASGARPAPLDIEGEEHVLFSDDFLELDQLPEKIVFIGGGFISFEFAHIAALSGSEVHILHRNENPLKNFDQELVKLLIKRSEEIGIKVHLNTVPEVIEKSDGKVIVHGKQNRREIDIVCDEVFHGAGRIPDIDRLDLGNGNIAYTKRGITVNEYLQSESNNSVYASGDVSASGGLPLTPVAGRESGIAADNIIHGNRSRIDYELVPSIVFTQPKLAIIGLTEEKAAKKGIDFEVVRFETKEWYTNRRTNEAYAMTKLVMDKSTGKIIGVHILGSNADELINYFSLIMKFDLPYDEVRKTIFAYPSSASDLSYFLK